MKTKNIFYSLLFLFAFFSGCTSNDNTLIEEAVEEDVEIDSPKENNDPNTTGIYKILSLGDSYTIGESVCETCRFPEQLKDRLIENFETDKSFELKVIARTGWTSTNLINAITDENINDYFDLVTLLIGVNNQYQGRPFSIYENEFPQLLNTAIIRAKGNKNDVIVVSIPDYAYTPFGRGNSDISAGIDKYNTYAKNYCVANNITYVNITDITRMGLNNTDLVASDGLHPSELAYSKFVERILPYAIEKLRQ